MISFFVALPLVLMGCQRVFEPGLSFTYLCSLRGLSLQVVAVTLDVSWVPLPCGLIGSFSDGLMVFFQSIFNYLGFCVVPLFEGCVRSPQLVALYFPRCFGLVFSFLFLQVRRGSTPRRSWRVGLVQRVHPYLGGSFNICSILFFPCIQWQVGLALQPIEPPKIQKKKKLKADRSIQGEDTKNNLFFRLPIQLPYRGSHSFPFETDEDKYQYLQSQAKINT